MNSDPRVCLIPANIPPGSPPTWVPINGVFFVSNQPVKTVTNVRMPLPSGVDVEGLSVSQAVVSDPMTALLNENVIIENDSYTSDEGEGEEYVPRKRGRPRKSEVREPFMGARVYVWRSQGDKLVPVLGMLQNPSRLDKDAWDIVCFGPGYLQLAPRHQVKHSAEPRVGHWSWLPNGVV